MAYRERITITIKAGLLAALDGLIDGSRIRNRSHAIEYLLTKQFFPKETKVLVLAGGKGIKLEQLGTEIPKGLAPIQGQPLLSYTLKQLAKNNFKDVILAGGHLEDQLQNAFGEGEKLGLHIQYIKDKETGTAQVLLQAKNQLKNDKSFFVHNGDILSKINYLNLLEYHKSHKGTATMALVSVDRPSPWGVAVLEGSKIISFEEKPKKSSSKSRLVNAGIYVFDTNVFNYLTPKTKSLEKDILPKLAQKGELYGYSFSEEWHDVGFPGIYKKIAKSWRR